MTVGELLTQATTTFEQAGIPSARLDAQVLLCRVLRQNKAWLLAHSDDPIAADKLEILHLQIRRRAAREPLAYILGEREFYGRAFTVNPHVLIPRPATEQLIDSIKSLNLPAGAELLDVGTGSGAIAITAALELPHLHVSACDISTEALATAQANAERLGAQVYFFTSNLLLHAPTYDVIVANMPYVDRTWQRSPETAFEPEQALFAGDNGLELITQLIDQVPAHLNPNGYVVLEADPRQFDAIKKATPMFTLVEEQGFCMVLQIRGGTRAKQ